MDIEKIKKLYNKNHKSSPGGISCVCITVSPKRVAKIYSSKRKRNSHYHTQKDAAKYGLGPKTYERFEFGRSYGYISERVYVCDHRILHDFRLAEHFESMVKKDWRADITKLTKELKEKVGFYARDLHIWNLGWNSKGELVWIDFGDTFY